MKILLHPGLLLSKGTRRISLPLTKKLTCHSPFSMSIHPFLYPKFWFCNFHVVFCHFSRVFPPHKSISIVKPSHLCQRIFWLNTLRMMKYCREWNMYLVCIYNSFIFSLFLLFLLLLTFVYVFIRFKLILEHLCGSIKELCLLG